MNGADSSADQAKATVAALDVLKQRARDDRRATSTPLLVFGAITALAVVVAPDQRFGSGLLYWTLAVPAGFAFLAWRQRRIARASGVGGGREPYGWLALGFPLIFLVAFGVLLFSAPVLAASGGLIYVAARTRNRFLGVCAAIYGLIGTLELSFYTVSNQLNEYAGSVDWDTEEVLGILAAFLVAAGLVARFREGRRS